MSDDVSSSVLGCVMVHSKHIGQIVCVTAAIPDLIGPVSRIRWHHAQTTVKVCAGMFPSKRPTANLRSVHEQDPQATYHCC